MFGSGAHQVNGASCKIRKLIVATCNVHTCDVGALACGRTRVGERRFVDCRLPALLRSPLEEHPACRFDIGPDSVLSVRIEDRSKAHMLLNTREGILNDLLQVARHRHGMCAEHVCLLKLNFEVSSYSATHVQHVVVGFAAF